jgi:hypothetical protein
MRPPGRQKEKMSDSNAIAKTASQQLEASIGGRDHLTDILGSLARDTKQDILFRLLCDPKRQKDSLIKICQDAGVSTTEVLSMLRDSVVSQALVRAQMTMADKLDAVARDVAEKAADHTKPCKCRILSAVDEADPECPDCGGRGMLVKEGSLKHAEAVFKAAGLTKDGGGVNVSVQQNLGVNVGGGFLDKFVKATDDAAFDVVPESIDAEEAEPDTDQ